MKMSIGAKLGLGFSIVIALMAISAGVAYYNMQNMQGRMHVMFDEVFPTVRSCDRLIGAVSGTVASTRGYLVFGENEASAAISRKNFEDDWTDIDALLEELTVLSESWDTPEAVTAVNNIKKDVEVLRASQSEVWSAAHTDANTPGLYLLKSEVEPLGVALADTVTTLLNQSSQAAQNEDQETVATALADVRFYLTLSLGNLRAYALTGAAREKQLFETSWQDYQEAVRKVDQIAETLSPAQRENWQVYQSLNAQFVELPTKIVAARGGSNWNIAEYKLEQETTPIARQLVLSLEGLSDFAVDRREQYRSSLEAASRAVVVALFGATIAGIIIASFVAVLLSRKIVYTVRNLAERAEQIAKGDLTGSEIEASSKDELGQLAEGFNTMIAGLKELSGQVHSVTENVNSAATQISTSAKQQAGSTREQVATVQEINSTMQEISRSGAQIIEKAKEVAAAAEAASSTSKSGMEAVQTMNLTTEAIRAQVEQVAENIVTLSEKTQAVGEIISTVNDIAEQSNLLALNATIEAAEAGDEGSRFSVVASEMKNLADQAKDCTVQVRKILSDIQKGINTSVMLTEEAVKRVESGKKQADLSELAIRQMSDSTEESVMVFQQIIAATNQQQVGFEQVTKGMADIDQATQQTASGTAQLEQAVASLSSLSGQLKAAVAGYRV